MPMSSSPFRASHRRSRSHTSLSSPTSSPIARSDRRRTNGNAPRSPLLISKLACGAAVSPADSPFSIASAFAAQPPEKWDVEAWRRGKKARRDPESPSEDADMESCDEPSSPIVESQPMLSPLSVSAPSTPLPRFATTSGAFQFFPSKISSSGAKQTMGTPVPHGVFSGSNEHGQHTSNLAQMQSEAFNDLRKTVSEAGEGFVRRMREFEAHRDRGPSRVSTSSSHLNSSACRLSPHKRGRKRPSPLSSRQRAYERASREKGCDSEDGESDIEIRSSCASGSDDSRGWSPSKKRAVSLSALSYQDAERVAHPRSLPFPIPLRSRDRGSSPSPSVYSDSSSDEDEEIRSSNGSVADRIRHRRALRFRSKAISSAKYSPPPLSFSFSTSNNSSHLSLSASSQSPISLFGSAPKALLSSSDHENIPGSAGSAGVGSEIAVGEPAPRPSKQTEKAVAALSLALANGAGSVSDYEALREAHGVLVMEDGEAGSLWD